MEKSQKKKAKAILKWYRISASEQGFDDKKKLALLDLWKEECINFEEYEIASYLNKERLKVIKSIKQKNREPRSLVKILLLRLRIIIRKILYKVKNF